MYADEIQLMAEMARRKNDTLRGCWLTYLLESALAGMYVGIGVILIFIIGAPFAKIGSPFLKPLMGTTFGIALTLVVFAGSELFTGNNMFMTLGVSHGTVGLRGLIQVWGLSWAGNFTGSLFLALLVCYSGALNGTGEFIQQISALKMNMPAHQMFFRAVLCNWLVCLALWTSARTKNDAAKCILIFWCLYAFIACGFEHSVANMTLLSAALLLPHGTGVSFAGLCSNLLWVSLGNIVGGALLVGAIYWLITRTRNKV